MTRGATESSCSKRRRPAPPSARARAALALASALVLAALLAPGAVAASPSRIVTLLNAQRAQNRIPAGITANATWTKACELHNAYEKRNNVFGQGETEGKPGFTTQGNRIAQTSVLAQGVYWGPPTPAGVASASGDPYDNAPYHLFDLLNPRISAVGAADSEGFGCVEIELGTQRAAPSSIVAYSYPGNHRTGIPASQSARERPESPAQSLGLGTGATGPNMFVYFDGPWNNGSRALISSATMTWAHGSVPLRWLDDSSSDLLAPTGAILVPAAPLRPGTAYHVQVSGTVTGVTPGTSVEEALPGCQEQPDGTVACGQPPSTTCIENFATQLAMCGLSRSWPVADSFSFTTARARRHH